MKKELQKSNSFCSNKCMDKFFCFTLSQDFPYFGNSTEEQRKLASYCLVCVMSEFKTKLCSKVITPRFLTVFADAKVMSLRVAT